MSSLAMKGCAVRLPVQTPMQTREFHWRSMKQSIQLFKDNKMLWVNDINNTALKYGLFGVTIGTPTSWVVSLITWMNQLGLPWWGAIAGGWIRM